jgi:hypothetical protein
MTRKAGYRGWLGTVLGVLLLLAGAREAHAVTHQWHLTVGSWNLMNLGNKKVTFPNGNERVNLLTRMGGIAGAYDILIFQEVLQDGSPLTAHLANYLPAGYLCNHVSAATGRAGRPERYVICNIPNNATGAIAVTAWTDYAATGNNYGAADGTMRPAQNVWMRPPVIARITFTPDDSYFNAVVFDIYTIHAKPAYGTSANARPPGTVALAPNNSVVHYELQAVENNLSPGTKRMLIGDLNGDCTYYPVAYRGTDFTAIAGWSWYVNYGQRTNTAVGAGCGYDRIILNQSLNADYEIHGIDYDHYDSTTREDNRRVSDHYPVWVRLGQTVDVVAQPSLLVAQNLPVTEANKKRKFVTTDTPKATGQRLKVAAANAKLFITAYDISRNYKSNFTYTLTDVRGAPTPVSTDADGNLVQSVSWASPPAGAYVYVFDANGDGKFSLADGDFANEAVEADILVTASNAGHNDLVTLDDNMNLRDVFDLAQARNVYALAKNLPANTNGYLYIVSNKLLRDAGYVTWEAARQANINLATYSIPIGLADSGLIDTSTIALDKLRTPIKTTDTGELFLSAWPRPGQLMNASVNYRPPPQSAFDPAFAGSGDPPASADDVDVVGDVCENAYNSRSANFVLACNVGFSFSNYYGSAFTLVLDMNSDGLLGPNDPIGTRDIGDMTLYFAPPGVTSLGPNANGNPAVSEYKEYLSRALSVQLAAGNSYDDETQKASIRYACGPTLSKKAFQDWIVTDARTGFRVLERAAYQSQRSPATGLYQFDQTYINGYTTNGTNICMSGNEATYSGDVNVQNGSNVTVVTNKATIENATVTSNDSTLCWAGVNTTAAVPLAVGAYSSFATAGTGFLVGLAGWATIEIGGVFACGLP